MSFIVNQFADYKKISEQLMNQYFNLYDNNLPELAKAYTSDAKFTFENNEFTGFSYLYNLLRNNTYLHSNVVCTTQPVGNHLMINCSGYLTVNNYTTYKFNQTLFLININGSWYITNDIFKI